MTDEKLDFHRIPGGYVAENHHRYYAVYSDWGWHASLRKNYFIWVLEVREKSDLQGLRTVVGRPPILTAQRRTKREAVELAQRFEDGITEALRERAS